MKQSKHAIGLPEYLYTFCIPLQNSHWEQKLMKHKTKLNADTSGQDKQMTERRTQIKQMQKQVTHCHWQFFGTNETPYCTLGAKGLNFISLSASLNDYSCLSKSESYCEIHWNQNELSFFIASLTTAINYNKLNNEHLFWSWIAYSSLWCLCCQCPMFGWSDERALHHGHPNTLMSESW